MKEVVGKKTRCAQKRRDVEARIRFGRSARNIGLDTVSKESSRGKSQAANVVEHFFVKNPILFHDERGLEYVALQGSQVLSLNSTAIRKNLAAMLYKAEGKVPRNDSITAALNILAFKASHGPRYTLNNRITWSTQGDIWLDLADEKSRAVQISKAGWSIEKCKSPMFRRYESQQPLAEPVHGGDPWSLLKHVNVQPKDKLLFMVYVVTLLIPGIPHPVLVLHGPQGSTKTTTMALLKELIDPSAMGVVTIPRDERELVQTLDHSYLNYFDNVSSLRDWVSDALCRATTGAGFVKRKLFTDDEDVIYYLQ